MLLSFNHWNPQGLLVYRERPPVPNVLNFGAADLVCDWPKSLQSDVDVEGLALQLQLDGCPDEVPEVTHNAPDSLPEKC